MNKKYKYGFFFVFFLNFVLSFLCLVRPGLEEVDQKATYTVSVIPSSLLARRWLAVFAFS